VEIENLDGARKGPVSIRILLADDHKILRQGIRSLLEKQEGIEVIAETDNGRDAVKLCREYRPDVVVMDVTMSDLNGIEATRQIVSECSDVKVIGLSMHSDRQFVEGMFKAGAMGYLLKDCAFQDVVGAIRAVASKQTYLSPKIARLVVEGYLQQPSKLTPETSHLLTAREREVLQLLAEGYTRKQIAQILHLSPRTVETYYRKVKERFNIENTAELIKFALREGLTSLER
jgi:two-component system response regulator NreC